MNCACSFQPIAIHERFAVSGKVCKLETGIGENNRTANSESVYTFVPENFFDLNQSDIMVVRTLRNVEPCEELFDTYDFFYKAAEALSWPEAWH